MSRQVAKAPIAKPDLRGFRVSRRNVGKRGEGGMEGGRKKWIMGKGKWGTDWLADSELNRVGGWGRGVNGAAGYEG